MATRKCYHAGMALTASDGADNQERFFAGCDSFGERSIGRIVGKILFAGKETQEGTTLQSVVIANGSAQHGIASFERVQHRALRDRGSDFERHFAVDVSKVAEMEGENYADHGRTHP